MDTASHSLDTARARTATSRGAPLATSPSVPVSRLSSAAIGRLGEDIAAAYLDRSGWLIVTRNFRVARGEIDIIALDGSTLVFVEVKARRSILTGDPQAAVTPQKLHRLRRLASLYLLENSPPHRDLRIDVLAVRLSDDEPPAIEHLRGVGT